MPVTGYVITKTACETSKVIWMLGFGSEKQQIIKVEQLNLGCLFSGLDETMAVFMRTSPPKWLAGQLHIRVTGFEDEL